MLLPELLTIDQASPTQLSLGLKIHTELDYFPDHFPGLPLLPGVVQVHWAIHYANLYLPVRGSFSSMKNIKFQAIMQPGAELQLMLEWMPDKHALEFMFYEKDRKFSGGQIIFSETA